MRTALLALAVLLTGCGTATGPAPASAPSQPVPWAALPATSPTLPSITIAASPDPAPAAAAPRCDAGDVRISGTKEGVGGGTVGLTLTLVAVGDVQCHVSGIPALTADDSGAPTFFASSRDDTSYDGPVLVTRDSPATLWLTWPTGDCTTPVTNEVLHVAVGTGTVRATGFGGAPACYTDGVDPGAPVSVHPWAPAEWSPALIVTSVSEIEVSGPPMDLSGAAGATVDFEVTLTAPTPVVLEPCPDYRIAKYGSDVREEETWALNCAAVPYRTEAGQPYLPEQTPVTFAMRTRVPAHTAEKVIWQLVGSDRGLGGLIRVR